MQHSFNTPYHHLKNRWTERNQELRKQLWDSHGTVLESFLNSTKQLMAGSIASIMLLSQPMPSAILAQSLQGDEKPVAAPIHTQDSLKSSLAEVLPKEMRSLNFEEENVIGKLLSENFNMQVSASLGGKRLNRSYGIIGAEQNLMRYPGDSVDNMAPGRGAWGYFADSKESMTQEDVLREKYYIAVQTFLAPGWNDNTKDMYEFFKYRKMLVVNPDNGKAMVVVIGDAGPAEWTGKHLGGSPEVMEYLNRQDGAAKGPVLYFFIDDPDNKIPLGPIQPV